MTGVTDMRPRTGRGAFALGALAEALPAAVLAVDKADIVRYANASARELASRGESVVGRRLSEAFSEEGRLSALAARARAAGPMARAILASMPSPSGRFAARVAASAAALDDSGAVAITLTPLAANRNDADPALATRTLAHEVRNPLAGIRAAAQLIARSDPGDVEALVTLICDEVDRIHRLTDTIDPFADRRAAPFGAVNVHDVLSRVRAVISSSAPGLRIEERYDPSLPPVRGDRDQLIQALLNIAKNAAEAVADTPGATLTLTTAFRPGLRLRRGPGARPRPLLEASIIDNGPGLPADVADRAFEPFATTKPGGMGLGLVVASDVVARHDGAIEVESRPGRTAFRVLLPVDDGDAP